jgi:hypothetical protein
MVGMVLLKRLKRLERLKLNGCLHTEKGGGF